MVNESAPASWKDAPGYVQVNSEADAKIVNFAISPGGFHSAVKTGSFPLVKYVSKYGDDGPLVAHDLFGSYYHLTGRYVNNSMEFWTYVGGINGNQNINIGNEYSYSVQSASGVTYSWTSLQNRFAIVNGSGTHSITISPNQVGSDVLRLTITGTFGQSKTQDFPITIGPACLQGTFTSSTQTNAPLNTFNSVPTGQIITNIVCANASSIQWTQTSGNAPFYIWNNNNVLIQMPNGGNISFKVDALSTSGQIFQSRNITFSNFGSFNVFPNPSNGDIKIDLNPELEFEMQIVNIDYPSVKSSSRMEGETTMDVRNLPDGEY